MTGFNTILKIQRLQEKLDSLGFMICGSKHGGLHGVDVVAIRPKDSESLPIYSRDAELFSGTLEELEIWLLGVQWARDYDRMLKVSDEKKRQRQEQNYRHKHLIQILEK